MATDVLLIRGDLTDECDWLSQWLRYFNIYGYQARLCKVLNLYHFFTTYLCQAFV